MKISALIATLIVVQMLSVPATAQPTCAPGANCSAAQSGGNSVGTLNVFQVPDRHLTSEQAGQIRAVGKSRCTGTPKINVTAALSDHEAQVFGSEIAQALTEAGCDADLSLPIPGLLPTVTGIHIGVRAGVPIPSGAQELHAILQAAHINHDFAPLTPDFFPDEPFVLVVGARP